MSHLPLWFRQKMPEPTKMLEMERLISGLGLDTICHEGKCPNRGECYSNKTAAFLILGSICMRNCAFCAVKRGRPLPVNDREPSSIASAVHQLQLKHVVVTAVSRDDLPDGGASHFAQVIEAIHATKPDAIVEVLIPDFGGSIKNIEIVTSQGPQIIGHNIETVPRLYSRIRPKASYTRSLRVISAIKQVSPAIVVKSGLMLGLGETTDEVVDTLTDLRLAGCDLLTLGQYLRPTTANHPVIRFVPPAEFASYRDAALRMGFVAVSSGPRVRSSYHANELFTAGGQTQTP